MIILDNTEWAGTEASLAAAEKIVAAINASSKDKLDGYDDEPCGYRVSDGIAVIDVKGPLINYDIPEFFASMFGVTTYPSLQRHFALAASDKDVNRVVLDVNSGGGSVSGLQDTVLALKALRAVKPVDTYASDSMCSAAYWLGSCSDSITMSEGGTTGSIGVIMVHTSERGAMEGEGYKPTVFRAGAKKALGHPAEDLTDEAAAEIQKGLDFHHMRFKSAVAENRRMTLEGITAVGDGQVFRGNEAVHAGLVDRLGTFDSVVKSKASVQIGGFPSLNADSGVSDMTLEEALAKVGDLEAQVSAGATALQAAEERAAAAENLKASLEASNKALTAALATSQSDVEAYAATLEANINAKAAALRVEVLIPESLEGKKAMNAQLEEKFQAKFPSGGVAAVANPEAEAGKAEAEEPSWFNRVIR